MAFLGDRRRWAACTIGALAVFACGGPRPPSGATAATASAAAAPRPPGVGLRRLAVGRDHACVRGRDGQVVCWGSNARGQLGAEGQDRVGPAAVAGLTGVAGLTAGSTHTCAALDDGTARCWGANEFGQLGDGTSASRSAPAPVLWLKRVQALSAGAFHTCAFDQEAGLNCWGGHLGGVTIEQRAPTAWRASPRPALSLGPKGVEALSSGHERTCLVIPGGEARCWSMSANEEPYFAVPEPVPGLGSTRSVAAGFSVSCALDLVGLVRCWGSGAYGQLGPRLRGETSAVRINEITQGTQLCVGTEHVCALQNDGAVACWGRNDRGQTGPSAPVNGLNPAASAPRLVPAIDDAVEIGCAHEASCALLRGGAVVCWGSDQHGLVSQAQRLPP